MNATELSAVSTTARPVVEITTASNRNQPCDQPVEFWEYQAPIFAGFLLTVSLHLSLTCRLISQIRQKLVKLDKFATLIIVQSVNEIVKATADVVYSVACSYLNLYIKDVTTNITELIRLGVSLFLMLRWKAIFLRQPRLDRLLQVVAAIAMLAVFIDRGIFNLILDPDHFVPAVAACSGLGKIILLGICGAVWYLVKSIDVSGLSAVSVNGKKRVVRTLILQLSFVVIGSVWGITYNVLESILSGNTILADARVEMAKYSDQATKDQIATAAKNRLLTIISVAPVVGQISWWWERIFPFASGIFMWWAARRLLETKKDPKPTTVQVAPVTITSRNHPSNSNKEHAPKRATNTMNN